MHVDESENSVFVVALFVHLWLVCHAIYLLKLFTQVLDRPHCWVESEVRFVVSSIQITTSYTCSVVAINDTVWVSHWNDLKNHSLPEFNRRLALAGETFEETVHHPRARGFARVHSAIDDDITFILVDGHFADASLWVDREFRFFDLQVVSVGVVANSGGDGDEWDF